MRHIPPASHDSDIPLYLFVLVLFNDAVVLSQVYVAFNIFYQHIIHVDWGVVYNHICLCGVHLKGALYRIQILCRRYTFWSYPAG